MFLLETFPYVGVLGNLVVGGKGINMSRKRGSSRSRTKDYKKLEFFFFLELTDAHTICKPACPHL